MSRNPTKREPADSCVQHSDECDLGQQLFPLTELPRRSWMPRKDAKPISKRTVIRWALCGRNGRKLRTTMVGGMRCTCDHWARLFFEYLATFDDPTLLPHRSPTMREKQIERAVRELEAYGL
jgi:hypothetical protein